jgi:hypothetical protein
MRSKEFTKPKEPDFIEMLSKFLPLAMEELGISKLPEIKLVKEVPDTAQPTFGKFVSDTGVIWLSIKDRHPLDIIRTLAHELTHYKQDTEHQLDDQSGETGSPAENEAHAMAGIIMRHFNLKHPEYFNAQPVQLK